MHRLSAVLGLIWLIAGAMPAAGCGAQTPCPVALGQYYLRLPESPAAGRPMIVYLHGYAATGKAELGNDGLVSPLLNAGFAVLAPDGQVDPLQGSHLDWGVADGGTLVRDDFAFLRQVIADAADRFDLAGRPAVIMGYSRGGSMVWDLACAAPDMADAFASHAGGFWAPMPDACAGPVRLLHSHGFTDTTLPFEGTTMNWFGHPFEMGGIPQGLSVWRRSLGCPVKANHSVADDGVWQKDWTTCDAGGQITLQLLPGGHGRRKGWSEAVLDWLNTPPAAE